MRASHDVRDEAPSGAQRRISYGDQHATIVEVGAGVREYRVGDRDVFHPYGEGEITPAYHGSVLVPWPNRIADGRYEFDGVACQLPITEPERQTALHGLATWARWTTVAHEPDRVVLTLSPPPMPGYPFFLDTSVEYSLGAAGLRVRATSTNTGAHACPYAIGFHPYAAAAPGTTLDECTLRLDVRRRLVCDDRLIPAGVEAVEAGPYDFSTPQALAGHRLDDAFTDVTLDRDGRSWLRLRGADGRTVAVWADANFGYWQVYSGDFLAAPHTRRGLAAEPMTAAPNAFRSGDGLIRLDPGASVTTTWGATLL